MRVPLEDVVTSTVFGPLEFMGQACRTDAIALLGQALSLPTTCANGEIRAHFWPRFGLADEALRTRYAEPDLVFSDDHGPLIVFEVKWGAPLGRNELAAQWASLPPNSRRRAVHVLLVQEPRLYRDDIEADVALIERRNLGPWNPLLRGWDLLAALPMLAARPGMSDGVRAWATAIGALLRREHRFTMHGWDALGLKMTGAIDWRFRQDWLGSARSIERHQGWWNDG